MSGKVYQNLRVLTTQKGLSDCYSNNEFNAYMGWLWGFGFIAFVIVGSIHAERAANAERINNYFFDPETHHDNLPYDTCKIPDYKLPDQPEPESYYWKQLAKDVQEYCDYDLDC